VSSVVLPFPPALRPRALDTIGIASREPEPTDAREPLDNVISLLAFARHHGRGDFDPPPREAA
jgi:hypothetical protein